MLVAVLKPTMEECFHTGDKHVSMETKPEIKPVMKSEVLIGWQVIDDSHPKHFKNVYSISYAVLYIIYSSILLLK